MFELAMLVYDSETSQQQGMRFQFDPAVPLTDGQLAKIKAAIEAAAESITAQLDVIAANPTPANVAEAL